MQITTSKAKLVAPLSLVVGAADTKGLLPMLGTVLLKATNGQLSMLCSDTGVLARAVTSCDVASTGELAVDVRRFSDLIRAVPDKQPIEIKADEKTLQIKSGRSRFKMPVLNAADYPRMAVSKEERLSIMMDGSRLAAMIKDVSLSMAVSDVRTYLNGALFRIDQNGLWLVSTDGNRLVVSHEPISGLDAVTPREVIIPRKTILLAAKLLDDGPVKLTLGVSDFQLAIPTTKPLDDSPAKRAGGALDEVPSIPSATVLLGKTIEGSFPSFRQVIPKAERSFTMEADRLTDSLSMISAMLESGSNSKDAHRDRIELVISHRLLTLQKDDSARCEVDTSTDCGDSTTIGINISYLDDAATVVRNHGSVVCVGYSASSTLSAITMRPKDADYPLAVIMPMR